MFEVERVNPSHTTTSHPDSMMETLLLAGLHLFEFFFLLLLLCYQEYNILLGINLLLLLQIMHRKSYGVNII